MPKLTQTQLDDVSRLHALWLTMGANLAPPTNLHNEDLSGLNLSGADLRWANLKGADLTGANLLCADLSYCNLLGSNLTDANLNLAGCRGIMFSARQKQDYQDATARSARAVALGTKNAPHCTHKERCTALHEQGLLRYYRGELAEGVPLPTQNLPSASCPECKGDPTYVYASGFSAPTPCSLCHPV